MPTSLLLTALLLDPPVGWVRAAAPSPSFEGDRVCANHSLKEWSVESVDGGLRISEARRDIRQDPLPFAISFAHVLPQPPPPPTPPGDSPARRAWDPARHAEEHARRVVLKLRDGWLVGFNAGEWGGSLWWFTSADRPGIKLSSENVITIFPAMDSAGALVFVGLAHLGIDRGEVLRFSVVGGAPTVTLLRDLGTEPQVLVSTDGGDILILTNKQLRRLMPDGRIADVCSVDYSGLYPTSLVGIPGEGFYVGMRHYVGRLSPKANGCSVEWFAPSDCSRFIGGADRCECGK